MTRFNPPLTSAESTALQQACAEMDEERLKRINHCDFMEMSLSSWRLWAKRNGLIAQAEMYLKEADARHLAAALLAGQMAERL